MSEPVALHRITRNIDMADIDAAGIIYFASPLRWQESIFSDWLRKIGHPLGSFLMEKSLCPVVDLKVSYHGPFRMDDVAVLTLFADHVGNSSFALRTEMGTIEQRLRVEVRVSYVWAEVDEEGQIKAHSIPDWLRNALQP